MLSATSAPVGHLSVRALAGVRSFAGQMQHSSVSVCSRHESRARLHRRRPRGALSARPDRQHRESGPAEPYADKDLRLL